MTARATFTQAQITRAIKAAPEVKPALMAIAELRVAKSRMKKPAQEATS